MDRVGQSWIAASEIARQARYMHMAHIAKQIRTKVRNSRHHAAFIPNLLLDTVFDTVLDTVLKLRRNPGHNMQSSLLQTPRPVDVGLTLLVARMLGPVLAMAALPFLVVDGHE